MLVCLVAKYILLILCVTAKSSESCVEKLADEVKKIDIVEADGGKERIDKTADIGSNEIEEVSAVYMAESFFGFA